MKKIKLGVPLTLSVLLATAPSWAVTITDEDEAALTSGLTPIAPQGSSDQWAVTGVTQLGSELDGARLGTATMTALTYLYKEAKKAYVIVADTVQIWTSYRNSTDVPSIYSANATIVLDNKSENGGVYGASGNDITIALEKTSSAANITGDQVLAALEGFKPTAAIPTTATTMVGVTLPVTGWTAKISIQTTSKLLLPARVTLKVPLTLPGTTTTVDYTGVIASSKLNLAGASTTLVELPVSQGSSVLKLSAVPGQIAHVDRLTALPTTATAAATAGPAFALLSGLVSFKDRAIGINGTLVGWRPKLTTVATTINNMFDASVATAKLGAANALASALMSQYVVTAIFGGGANQIGSVGAPNIGLVTLGSAISLTAASWNAEGSKLSVTGAVTGQAAKTYTCDFSAITGIATDRKFEFGVADNKVATFFANDGDFFCAAVGAAGGDIDGTDDAAITANGDQVELIALRLANKFKTAAQATIPAADFKILADVFA